MALYSQLYEIWIFIQLSWKIVMYILLFLRSHVNYGYILEYDMSILSYSVGGLMGLLLTETGDQNHRLSQWEKHLISLFTAISLLCHCDWVFSLQTVHLEIHLLLAIVSGDGEPTLNWLGVVDSFTTANIGNTLQIFFQKPVWYKLHKYFHQTQNMYRSVCGILQAL
jgi:hypothetical protein